MSSERALTGVSDLDSIISETSQPPLQLQIPTNNAPKPSDTALAFFSNLTDDDFKYILFEDNLSTISDNGKEIGDYKMSVMLGRRDDQECFVIDATSHGYIEGVPCGTSIKAFVTVHLETIEQSCTEFVKIINHPINRQTIFKRNANGYHVQKDVTQDEKTQTFAKSFDFGTMEGFISEGANLLLQRLLIIKPIPSYFEVIAFDSDTNLCQAEYSSLGDRQQTIGAAETLVIGLQRTIHSLSDLPTTWHTYYMRDGHLITRTQIGSPIMMKVLQLPELIEPDEHIPKPLFEKKPLNWEDDMQLYSKYLDCKEEIQADYLYYLRQHPEVRCLIGDFLQHILLRKPNDIIASAEEYFSAFSARLPLQRGFLSSAENTKFDMGTNKNASNGMH